MSFQKIYRYFIQEQEFIALSFYGTLIQFLVQFRHVLSDVPHQLLLSVESAAIDNSSMVKYGCMSIHR